MLVFRPSAAHGTAFGWFTLTWVFVLGIVSCSLLGIFVSNLASNALSLLPSSPTARRSALQFLSGTYVPLMGRRRRGC